MDPITQLISRENVWQNKICNKTSAKDSSMNAIARLVKLFVKLVDRNIFDNIRKSRFQKQVMEAQSCVYYS